MHNSVEVWRSHYSQLWQMAELVLGTVYCKYSVYYILLGGVTRRGKMTAYTAWITAQSVQ